MPLLLLSALAGSVGCAHNQTIANHPPSAPPAPVVHVDPAVAAMDVRAEQIRNDCIAGRRLICGRILQVATNGIVVDSGYTDLLRPPIIQSWLIPGTVPVTRNSNAIELNQPGAACFGLVFLTDLPRRKTVHKYDYVVLIGYPAGQYLYRPLPGVEKPIRKFAAGLDTAVRLKLKDEQKSNSTHPTAS